MANKPELSIKVSVDPVIDGEKLKSDIQTQVDNVKELPKVSVEVDVDSFSSSLSNKMKDELKDVNKKLKYYLTEITTTSKDLNKAVVNLFADANFADRIDKQFKEIETSIEDTKKSAISASSYFDDIFNSSSVKNLTEFYSLLDKVGAGMNKLSSASTNTRQFNSQFKALSEDAQTLYDVLLKFSNKSIDVDFLKKIGMDSENYNFAVNNITYLMNALNELYNFNGTTESKEKSPIKRLASEIGTDSEEITGVFQDVKTDLTDLMKTILENAEKAENAKKKLSSSVETTSGGFDKEKVNEISQAYLKAMSVLVNQQRILNTTKRSTIELEDNLLNKTKEVSTAIGEEVTSLKSLFNEVSKSDIGKQLPAVSEYMKSKAELEASKNIENAKNLSLNVNSSSAKEYEAALKGIKDRISELGKEGAFDGLNNNIDENERAFINAKEYIKDYASALDEIKSKSRDTRLPQQRTTGLNVSNIENYSQKVTAIKNDLYALKDTVFPAVYADINRTYGHLFDDSITNVQSYIDKLNEIPAAALSKAPAKTQHSKKAETIDSTNIKNYATLLNGIQGAMKDMKTTIVPGFDEVLDKNGKKINDIGTSLVNYVAVLKRGLKAVDQSEKTIADKTAKKPAAIPVKNNVPAKNPTTQKIQDAKVTVNSNEVIVIGDPVDIPVKATLKKKDITVPKTPIEIKVKTEITDTAVKAATEESKKKSKKKIEPAVDEAEQLSFDSPELVVQKEEQKPIELPLPETPNYTKPSETLDNYRDSVGAAAGIQEYFASEVDNATASLGSQSETLKALKKNLDEYTDSIDGVEKFAKAEKELDQLKKKLAQQQQQQPAQPAPRPQPNNQPPAPIKPNNNPKPHNNGQPPAPPTPPNNQPPNNGGNNGGSNNPPVENQQKLEQALEGIMTKMITAQNKKDTSGDKGYEKNVAEQVKWQGQLQDQAEELIDKLNANYPGWEKGKSWQRHGERIAYARNDYSTVREDKQDLDTVQKLGKELQRNLKLREDLHKIDKNVEPVKYQNTQDDIKKSKAEIVRLRSEAKAKGLNTNEVTSDFLRSASELQERMTNKAAAKAKADADDLFDEYKRLTSKLQTHGQKRASSIGSDNVQAQSNVLRDYINTQTELNKLESEFKNRGFLKASSEEWQQTYDLMEKRKDLEKAAEFEVNNRIQAEQEAIRVQDEDRISLLNYIKTVEKYKDRLEQDNHTDDGVYGDSVKMANAGWDLLSELNKNPNDKNQVANLWGQKYGIQGVTDLESAFKALAVEAGKAGIKVQDLRTETEKLRSVTQAKTNIANLKSQLIDYLEKFPKVEKALAEPVQKLKAALADPNAYKNAGQLKQALAELRAQAKSLGLESENLIDKFEKLFGQHLSTMITMAALHKMQDALRIVYQNVVEIDTALIELRKVSELSGKALEEYMGRAAEQAQSLGVSISDYIGSTADWKRLGYSDEDAENMATYSTLLKNVGDGIDDVNTSSSYLISTLQGFGLLAKDAESVVDKIDKVANTQPITAQAIGEILTRSAASMKAANNDLAETISLGTAAYAVIQNAETVGTTLKSVSMYLRAAKSELESAGESADGCANSVSELRSELKSLTGVDIMIDNKNFKSTYQILKELSQVWDKLSDVTQANVTEMIGGKRNANAVSAILNNFDVAESSLEAAANSAGTAWEENSVWLDSIQARLSQLDASFQALSQDVLSSDLVKTGVSFLTSIVKLLDQIVNLTGALPLGLGIGAFVTQLGEPKMTGFMIVPSNTPGGDTEQARCSFYWRSAAREYLVKPTNMVA